MSSPSHWCQSAQPPQWGEIPDLWNGDGSLRDLYVLHVDAAEWLVFLSWSTQRYAFDYLVDGVVAGLPSELSTLAARGASQLLRIKIEGVHLHCHFFGGDSIELDVDPKEVRECGQHFAVLEFMSALGLALNRCVVLCAENHIAHPILRFKPDTRLWETCQVLPASGLRVHEGNG